MAGIRRNAVNGKLPVPHSFCSHCGLFIRGFSSLKPVTCVKCLRDIPFSKQEVREDGLGRCRVCHSVTMSVESFCESCGAGLRVMAWRKEKSRKEFQDASGMAFQELRTVDKMTYCTPNEISAAVKTMGRSTRVSPNLTTVVDVEKMKRKQLLQNDSPIMNAFCYSCGQLIKGSGIMMSKGCPFCMKRVLLADDRPNIHGMRRCRACYCIIHVTDSFCERCGVPRSDKVILKGLNPTGIQSKARKRDKWTNIDNEHLVKNNVQPVDHANSTTDDFEDHLLYEDGLFDDWTVEDFQSLQELESKHSDNNELDE